MAKTDIVHVYDCDEDTFWTRVVLDREFNEKLYLQELGFLRWEQTSFEETDDEVRRTVEVAPPVPDLPAVLKKLIDGGIAYTQRDVFEKKSRTMRTKIEPHRAEGRIKIWAQTTTAPVGEGKTRRTFSVNVEVKVFGVAGMAEKRVLQEMRRGYDEGAAHANAYLKSLG